MLGCFDSIVGVLLSDADAEQSAICFGAMVMSYIVLC
jgi:hypothetical protein